MSELTRPARREEIEWVAPVVTSARLVDDMHELVALWMAEPWRVRVTDRGEAAMLGLWHASLPLCAVQGLWCSPERVAPIVRDLCDVARDRSFDRLLGPMVPEPIVRPYLDGGLHRLARILVMRLERPRRVKAPSAPRDGVTVRDAVASDIDRLVEVDAESFEEFWRCDTATIERYAAAGRLIVATREGQPIGYTLATVRAGEGSLGRLAVVPGERGRGTGRVLATEAIAWMARQGARAVVLSTQDENMVSRRLYGSLGFREQPEALALTISGPLRTHGEE